jgi:trans-aconitate methyltransferase
MMPDTLRFALPTTFDSTAWLVRWDTQQAGYLPDREERFSAMLDVLEVVLPPDFFAVDLCCGPGSLSQRLLERFPQARVLAVDLDPVLLALGQAALGDQAGRLRWAEADLMAPEALHAIVGDTKVDAVLSTTALHWLPDPNLATLYQHLAALIRPGGVLLNGDNLNFAPDQPTLQQVSDQLTERIRSAQFQGRGIEDWDQWWAALGAEPGMQELLAERERRFNWRNKKDQPTTMTTHITALHNAGFREVGPIWQHLDNVVLVAVR